MSDFDKFFAERLEEEAQFPNKNRNWRGLSKRLDALDTGQMAHRPRLRLWQGVAAAAVVACGLLLWKMQAHQSEIRALHQEIAQLTETLHEAQSVQPAPIANTQKNALTEENSVGFQAQASETTPAQLPITAQNDEITEPTRKTTAVKRTGILPENVIPAPPPAAPGLQGALTQNASSPPLQEAQKTAINAGSAGIHAVESNDVQHQANTAVVSAGANNDSLQSAVAITPAVTEPGQQALDTMETKTAGTTEKQQPLNVPAPAQQKETVAEAAKINPPEGNIPPAIMIKPAGQHDRFRIGPYALLGFVQPKQAGVSTISGQGIEAGYRVWRSLRLQASAEWLHFNISSTRFPERFYPHHDTLPKPPDHNMGGGNPGMYHQELVQVESSQRHQQFGIGMQYTLPVRWWVKPTMSVAYNLIRVSPTLVTYKFKDEFHQPGHDPDPDPEYVAEKIDKQWIENQWRFGIGLEKTVNRWVFGINADYTKSFADTTPAFNTLYLRAGVQYQM